MGCVSTPRAGRFTSPTAKRRYSLYRRLGGPQGRFGRVWKISSRPGFGPRPVASRYTDWAVPAHSLRRVAAETENEDL